MTTDGSARACGVGACARLIPTLGAPGEASGPRIDGFHRLDSPRTPGASGARGREDPSWVAAMACLWGDVLSKTKLGDTGPRRQQDSTTGATTASAHRTPRNPKNYRFHPQVLAVSVSLDHERSERSSNPLTGASDAAGIFSICVNFFGLVRTLTLGHKRESRARTFIS